jgi:tight adherence protein B
VATGSGGRVVGAADAQALEGAFARVATGPSPVKATVRVAVPNWLAGTGSTLNVTLTAGTTKLRTAGTPVTFAAGPGLAEAAVPGSPRWPLELALAAIGAAALLVGAGVAYTMVGRSTVRLRLRQLEGFGRGRRAGGREAAAGSALRAAVSGAENVIGRRGNLERIEAELDRAGMNLRATEWIMARLGVALLGALFSAMLLPWLVGLVLGGLAGWFGMGGYRRLRAARRTRRFGDQLPEALQLVVSALRSGFSFPQAIGALAQEGEAAVAGEFGRALAENRVGGDLEDALLRVAERNASDDLAWLVMAIRVQREVGGALSEVLETAVDTMRERARLRRHVRALSAEGRLSAWVLTGMPIVLAAFMFTFRREYLRPLYTTPLGLMMLLSSVVMMGFGIFWMTRVIRVEV